MRDAFVHLVRTTAEKRDQNKVAASTNASERLIGILDEHLAKRDYMTGGAFTMGDIPVGLQVHRWLGCRSLACRVPTSRRGTRGCALVRVRKRF